MQDFLQQENGVLVSTGSGRPWRLATGLFDLGI